MPNKLAHLKECDQVIVAVGNIRFYDRIKRIMPDGVYTVGYGFFRNTTGYHQQGKEIYKDRFIVIKPTQDDYEKAEKDDLVRGIAKGATKERLESLDLETLRKLANLLY